MTANAEDERAVRRALADEPAVDVVVVPSDDSWARDTAPTFVVDGRGGLGGVDWRFNAYGGIYEEYGRTRGMARRILDLLGARRFAAPLVLEGGAVHVDGEGTVLTTEEVVLDPRRNPDLDRVEAERLLCAYLGAGKVVWLTSALDHDNTGGHVDNLACFTAPGVVAALGCADRDDPQYEASTRTSRACARRPTPTAARWRSSSCPCRRARSSAGAGSRPATSTSTSPTAGSSCRPSATRRTTWRATSWPGLFPRRAVVQVPTLELAKADGGVHCVTQQQPVA